VKSPLAKDLATLRRAIDGLSLEGRGIHIQSVERAASFEGLLVQLVILAPSSEPDPPQGAA
jgi:hypothetical protein